MASRWTRRLKLVVAGGAVAATLGFVAATNMGIAGGLREPVMKAPASSLAAVDIGSRTITVHQNGAYYAVLCFVNETRGPGNCTRMVGPGTVSDLTVQFVQGDYMDFHVEVFDPSGSTITKNIRLTDSDTNCYTEGTVSTINAYCQT